MVKSTRAQHGFILLYVLAVMVILSGLALSVAFRERIGVQLVHNVVDATHDEYVLRSALALTKAQLSISSMVEPMLKADSGTAGRLDPWQAGDERRVPIGDSFVTIKLEAGAASPDFNLFDEQEIGRLFVAMGVDAEKAKDYAKAVLSSKPADGFPDNDALKQITGVPAEWLLPVAQGGNGSSSDKSNAAKADGNKSDPTKSADKHSDQDGGKTEHASALIELVEVGSKSKRIDLDRTPLEVVAALANLKPEQVLKLQRLRLAGPVDKDQAVQTVGNELTPLLGTAQSMMATMQMDGSETWAQAHLLRNGTNWTNSDFKLRHGQPEPNKQEEGAG
jgi:hypothetical protein